MQLRMLVLVSLAYSWKITPEENMKLKKKCGAHKLGQNAGGWKTLGGKKVRSLHYPWIAAVTITNGSDVADAGCSAVQISRRHILTAAHCVLEMTKSQERICNSAEGQTLSPKAMLGVTYNKLPVKIFSVYFGSKYLHPELSKQKAHKITRAPQFAEYNPCTSSGDLAIVELDKDIPAGQGTPICMPERNISLTEKLKAVGYGLDPKQPNPDDRALNWLHELDVNFVHFMGDRKLIVTQTKGKSICGGDSGGPLVQLNKQKRYTLVGIIVGMMPDCEVKLQQGEGVCPIG